MPSHQPNLTLSQLRTSESFSLRLYAFSDVSRCIVQRGRRTMCVLFSESCEKHSRLIIRFRFVTDDVGDSATTPTPGEEPWATYLGLPDSIINLLADIVNLCADQPTESAMTVKLRADKIESALNAWKPTALPSTAIADSTALVSRTIAGQLWRLCAIVLLYQVRFHQMPSLTSVCPPGRRPSSHLTTCPERDSPPPRLCGAPTQR